MSLADDVRNHCRLTYVEPARKKGQTTIAIKSGDVHKDLKYKNRYPLVCAAIGSNIFEDMCNLKRLSVDGPLNGVSTLFTFKLLEDYP